MENNMKKELDRGRKAAWAAFKSLEEAADQITDPKQRGIGDTGLQSLPASRAIGVVFPSNEVFLS
ncbi:hypothetical protein KIN20_022744 [Parelaphostrongylus tenuis]|uniref:Uncharacterized protein n=1 Tax=Parelaphostrongylus tenuis TaxID=148309 RepID=A0AAD5N8B2_PARTN|nr:hypothetical protein KIN20_022744 [Parelaphostrongylus tenuis]